MNWDGQRTHTHARARTPMRAGLYSVRTHRGSQPSRPRADAAGVVPDQLGNRPSKRVSRFARRRLRIHPHHVLGPGRPAATQARVRHTGTDRPAPRARMCPPYLTKERPDGTVATAASIRAWRPSGRTTRRSASVVSNTDRSLTCAPL
jgi:hypothetical protein